MAEAKCFCAGRSVDFGRSRLTRVRVSGFQGFSSALYTVSIMQRVFIYTPSSVRQRQTRMRDARRLARRVQDGAVSKAAHTLIGFLTGFLSRRRRIGARELNAGHSKSN